MIRRLLLAAACVTAPLRAAQAETCRVSGKAMIEAAASVGRESITRPLDGRPTTCTPSWPAVTVGAEQATAGACEITFMEGATLAPGWSIVGANAIRIIGGARFRYRAPRPTRSLSFTIIAVVPPGASENISLREIKLVGPDCADWQSAIQ